MRESSVLFGQRSRSLGDPIRSFELSVGQILLIRIRTRLPIPEEPELCELSQEY
jgi:hypothetical protein